MYSGAKCPLPIWHANQVLYYVNAKNSTWLIFEIWKQKNNGCSCSMFHTSLKPKTWTVELFCDQQRNWIKENKAERGFGLLAQAAKPSVTRVVHWGSHPSKY